MDHAEYIGQTYGERLRDREVITDTVSVDNWVLRLRSAGCRIWDGHGLVSGAVDWEIAERIRCRDLGEVAGAGNEVNVVPRLGYA